MDKLTPPDPNHPAVKAAPKNLREAAQRIVDTYDKGCLATTRYTGNGRMCAIGCLFTPAQRSYIVKHRLNETGVRALIEYVGESNLFFMTRMTPGQRWAIQDRNDAGGSAQAWMIESLRSLASGRAISIGGVDFIPD